MKTDDKGVYYDFRKILSRNGVFNFIAGGRGIGKTYGAKKTVLKRAITRGEQFIFIRRYKEELAVAAAAFLADIAHEFPDHEFRKTGKYFQMTKDIDRADGDKKWVTIGYALALSVAQYVKGVAYPKVYWIIYDEFIAEAGRKYLPDEVTAMTNFYNTVDRFDDRVRVLFLANSVTIMNPYFLAYEIRPDECGEWFRSKDGFIVAHFPDEEDFKNAALQTRFGRFIAGTEYANYALENQFSDAHDGLIRTKTMDAVYMYSIDTDQAKFSVWRDKYIGEYFLLSKAPKKETIYVVDPKRMRDGTLMLLKSDPQLKYLMDAFRRGLMFFDKPVTRNAFLETLK